MDDQSKLIQAVILAAAIIAFSVFVTTGLEYDKGMEDCMTQLQETRYKACLAAGDNPVILNCSQVLEATP